MNSAAPTNTSLSAAFSGLQSHGDSTWAFSSAGVQAAAAAAIATTVPAMNSAAPTNASLTAALSGLQSHGDSTWAFPSTAPSLIASAVLLADPATVQATAGIRTLCAALLAGVHSDSTTNPGYLTVFRTDETQLGQIALATSTSAPAIVGVGA
jgi:hypothetical protein